jgi:hypothetical protein
MTAVLLLFRFVFAFFHFRFASDFYVAHRCETSEKITFFASKRKKIRFRFASFRFEAKMTAHPNLRLWLVSDPDTHKNECGSENLPKTTPYHTYFPPPAAH